MTDINIHLPEEEPAPIVEETPTVIVPPAMSDADVADLARLRAEESARVEAEAEETRRIAEQALAVAEEAARTAATAEADAVIAEVEAEEAHEEERPEEEHEEEHHEEDETPNVDSAWFRKVGSKS
jgi:hypothetical protein